MKKTAFLLVPVILFTLWLCAAVSANSADFNHALPTHTDSVHEALQATLPSVASAFAGVLGMLAFLNLRGKNDFLQTLLASSPDAREDTKYHESHEHGALRNPILRNFVKLMPRLYA